MSNSPKDTSNPYAASYGAGSYGTQQVGNSDPQEAPQRTPAAPPMAPPPAPAASGGFSLDPNAPPVSNEVKDVTTQSFGIDVIEASKTRPVLVDFWAPWCGPCKQLAPMIERAVARTNGAVALTKMNIDEHPEISGQMGIKSIPAVVAFVNGKPADAFMGAVSESKIKSFIEQLIGPQGPSEIDLALDEAEKLVTEDQPDHAAEIFAAILQREPDNTRAIAGIGDCYLAKDDVARAREFYDMINEALHKDQRVVGLLAKIELAEQANDLGDLDLLMKAIEANPMDHQTRIDYAVALNAKNHREEAAEQLLESIRLDRNWSEEAARKQLLQFFEAWGNSDPATLTGRRGLSSALFS